MPEKPKKRRRDGQDVFVEMSAIIAKLGGVMDATARNGRRALRRGRRALRRNEKLREALASARADREAWTKALEDVVEQLKPFRAELLNLPVVGVLVILERVVREMKQANATRWTVTTWTRDILEGVRVAVKEAAPSIIETVREADGKKKPKTESKEKKKS